MSQEMRVCQPVSLWSSVSGKNIPLKEEGVVKSVLGYMLKKVSMMFIYLVTLKNFLSLFVKHKSNYTFLKYEI